MNKKKSNFKGVFLLIVIVSGILISTLALTTLISYGGFTYELKTFSSYDELLDFLHDKQRESHGFGISDGMISTTIIKEVAMDESNSGVDSVDYSTTNIQVEGVDEPDIVKNDAKYIYLISGSS